MFYYESRPSARTESCSIIPLEKQTRAPKRQVRKTAFGSVDAVNHRHFEDPAEAIRSLKAQGAFVCALETTEGASSLFDVRFPLPPSASRNDAQRKKNAVWDAEETRGREGEMRDSGTAAEMEEGGQSDGGRPAGRPARGDAEGGVLEEGGVVALVLGNEVTGVDERVLGLCDLVVEVSECVVLPEKNRQRNNA